MLRILKIGEKKTLADLVAECELAEALIKDAELETSATVCQVSKGKRRGKRKDSNNSVSSKDSKCSENSKSNRKCFNCGKHGHVARDCGKGQDKKNVECFCCGHKGHFARDCRAGMGNRKKRKNVLGISANNPFESSKVGVKVRFGSSHDEHQIQVDTGSELTIISEKTWNKIGRPSLLDSKYRVKAANGTPIALEGVFLCAFEMLGYSGSGMCYVSRNIEVIGLDWLGRVPAFWKGAEYCGFVKMELKARKLSEAKFAKTGKSFQNFGGRKGLVPRLGRANSCNLQLQVDAFDIPYLNKQRENEPLNAEIKRNYNYDRLRLSQLSSLNVCQQHCVQRVGYVKPQRAQHNYFTIQPQCINRPKTEAASFEEGRC